MELVQDWTDYNDSDLWKISESCYKSEGIYNWSRSKENSLPQLNSTNYQTALAFASFIKKHLAVFPQGYKYKVLESGAGSGRFSRNLLLALSELGILNRVILTISDFQESIINEIKIKKILYDFSENINFEFKLLDLCKPDLEDKYDLVIANFVLEALPLTVLKKEKNNFEELQVRIEKLKSIVNPGEEKLLKSYRWQEYDWDSQSYLERKHKNIFVEYYNNGSKKKIVYPYYAIEALMQLYSNLSNQGLIFLTSLNDNDDLSPWFYSGKIVSHLLDLGLIDKLFSSDLLKSVKTINQTRTIIAKDQNIALYLESALERFFRLNKKINKLIGLEINIENFASEDLLSCYEYLLKEFSSLNPNSAKLSKLWGDYYRLVGDGKKAIKYYREAELTDFWQDLN